MTSEEDRACACIFSYPAPRLTSCATLPPTATGLRVTAEFDPGNYPTGVVISDQVMDSLPITAHDWHGELHPAPRTTRPAARTTSDPARPA